MKKNWQPDTASVKQSMIYHIPYAFSENPSTGSSIRPVRMLEAFISLGYRVEVVAGTSKERSVQISRLKKRITGGEKFEFLYSESHTMPTALTEADHLPRRPLMDLAFLRFVHRRQIKVGLFYRDVYWRFPEYRERLKPLIHWATRTLYRMDLLAYRSSVDALYLPSLAMGEYVPWVPKNRHRPLPPGGEVRNPVAREGSDKKDLHLLYVGGLGGYYNLEGCVSAVAASKHARLTICTREAEWQQLAARYEPLMNERIRIVHESGSGLELYYAQADLCMLFIEPSVYRAFAAPIKFAEYIGFAKPVIVNTGTNVAEFVADHGNGWTIPFETPALTELLDRLSASPELLSQAKDIALTLRHENTWLARAREVAVQLGSLETVSN